MANAVLHRNQFDYAGVLARPPLSLWGDGRQILSTLYDAFSDKASSLEDYQIEGEQSLPATQGVRVSLGARQSFRFGFTRIEARLTDFRPEEVDSFFDTVRRGVEGLVKLTSEVGFQSHLLLYGAHLTLVRSTSTDFLRGLTNKSLAGLGTDRGTGLIFHADVPDTPLQVQLTVDHSLLVANGLFIQLALSVATGKMDVEATRRTFETLLLERTWSGLGLQFEGGS
jgi:hypothetical protein